ncbi:MmgE/PrpD family protein [Aquabacter spiritensis]|uniref:2-methylcitrate dehydratase PrpD n=1 Tax=Aquabacter spiritensis TaxID=933073 RepID=A0A4R3M829_9HYPH|nr:MmgE/PrpD family protein [Aquabacter spiritensis]TCT07495.1 2-methylcitrate dehydratase PrpD [Aquabacter spiritensis]
MLDTPRSPAPRSPAHDLVDVLFDISLARLPARVAERARVCLIEALGCGVFGAGQVWSRILVEEVLSDGAKDVATIIGHAARTSAPGAALCNGTAIHGYELDDLIAASVVHPGACVIPAALAAGEAANASGARVLEAIVAGYETMHRLGLAIGHDPSKKGFHVTAVTGPVACAVSAGLVMNLSKDQLLSAIGIACSAASGIKSFATGQGGGMVKRLHLGRAAEAGVRACQLAARGFLGPPFAIDGRFGLLDVFGGAGTQPEALRAGLSERWAIEQVWFKVFPICGWIQSVVQLCLELRGAGPLRPEDVAGVRVGVSAYAAQNNGAPAPVDTMGAQYSIPYCAALALTGDPRDPALYAPAALDDPARRALARRVEVVVDPRIEAVYPGQFGSSVGLRLADGRTADGLVLDCHGTPSDPCTETESREKFRLLTRQTLSQTQADALIAAVGGIAELPAIRALMHILSDRDAHA